jgi:hypothetical protein
LPFELPTRYYLVINRSTAKALGLAIPQELWLRADMRVRMTPNLAFERTRRQVASSSEVLWRRATQLRR